MYRLQSYTAQNVYDASQTYISGHLVQHLREGAEVKYTFSEFFKNVYEARKPL